MSYQQMANGQARRLRALAHRALDAGDVALARQLRDRAERLAPGAQTSVDDRIQKLEENR